MDTGWTGRWILAAVWVACASGLTLFNTTVLADERTPAVTPYRPSVSTPAQLSAPGWLEGEFGLLRAQSAGPNRDSAPFTLKLAFSPEWGVRIGGEALVHQSNQGYRFGDTALILKRRFAFANFALGLEGGVIAPTGHDDSGSTAYTINTLFSADFGPWHNDTNYFGTRFAATSGLPGYWQWGWASALSRTLGDRWGATGELSGTHQPGQTSIQLLAAASYTLRSGSVIDFGFAHELQAGAQNAQWFVGVTTMLARVLH